MNIITVLFILSMIFLVICIVLCCKYSIGHRCPSCFGTILGKIERKLFWNSLLRAFLEMYYSMGIFFFFTLNGI